VCIIVRQTPVSEQSFSEQHALRVLGRRGRDWRDRLTASAGLEGWRLSGYQRGGVETNEGQQEMRKPAPAYGLVTVGGSVEGAGWHEQFIVERHGPSRRR
jgi:hypothetical protein